MQAIAATRNRSHRVNPHPRSATGPGGQDRWFGFAAGLHPPLERRRQLPADIRKIRVGDQVVPFVRVSFEVIEEILEVRVAGPGLFPWLLARRANTVLPFVGADRAPALALADL